MEQEQVREQRPVLRVVHGAPTPEELAALVGVLISRRPAPAVRQPQRSRWQASALPAPAWRPGPGAWRA